MDEKLKSGAITQAEFNRFWSDAISVKGNDFINQVIGQQSIHLLIHGHQHRLAELTPVPWRTKDENCRICPAGSFGIQDAEPNCLNVIRIYSENGRLGFSRLPVEYDPLAPLDGYVSRGAFRDTGRKLDSGSFPVPEALQYWVSTTDGEEKTSDAPEHIYEQITMILVSPLGDG